MVKKTPFVVGLLLIAVFAQADRTEPRALGAWKILYQENFENLSLPTPAWSEDTYPDDGIYSDNGDWFRRKGIKPPLAYRAHAAFGKDGWLTFETYTRSKDTKVADLISVVPDPDGGRGHALKITSAAHTDATVIRPTRELPPEYRICVDVGYADFGSGKSDKGDLNGYKGGERAEPWLDLDATEQNGFYWLTILDSAPRPHNNVWIHHHRKVVIDSDNNKAGWTNIWNGREFKASGEHPVMMFAVAKDGKDDEVIGKPFISYAKRSWQEVGLIRAADAYRDKTWYTACIERTRASFGLSTMGDFKYGGRTTYTGRIRADKVYQADAGPEFFMFGDPHNNFYRGTVYYRNLRLEIPRDASAPAQLQFLPESQEKMAGAPDS